jgi:hypothetical protein
MTRQLEKSAKRLLSFFLAGALAALAGYFLSGCDGGGAPEVDAGAGVDAGAADARPGSDVVARSDAGGLGRTDAGSVYCAIPSPTGDAVNEATGRTAREDVALELATSSYVAFVVVSNAPEAQAICLRMPGMTEAGCADAARDFPDSAGARHCFDPADPCRPTLSGSSTCELSMLGVLSDEAPKPRRTAFCSPEGVFVGWWCANGLP